MFHVYVTPAQSQREVYTECKRSILCRMQDAGAILQYLAEHDVQVGFARPESLSQKFEAAADAGSVSVLSNTILLDARKSVENMADDLARRVRVLIQAPKPNVMEQFLFDRMGVVYGRFMKLEQKDGLTP
jgi:hypothetical protein